MRENDKISPETKSFVNISTLVVFCIPVFSAIIVYSISSFFQFPKSSFVGTVDGWLGFSGGVIGGTLTVFGVILTLREQNKLRFQDEQKRDNERKEEDRKKSLPYFETYFSNADENKMLTPNIISLISPKKNNNSHELNEEIVAIFFKNTSKSLALNTRVYLIDVSLNNKAELNPNANVGKPFIPPNSGLNISFKVSCKSLSKFRLKIGYKITFDDAVGNNYVQEGFSYFHRDVDALGEIKCIEDISAPIHNNKK